MCSGLWPDCDLVANWIPFLPGAYNARGIRWLSRSCFCFKHSLHCPVTGSRLVFTILVPYGCQESEDRGHPERDSFVYSLRPCDSRRSCLGSLPCSFELTSEP